MCRIPASSSREVRVSLCRTDPKFHHGHINNNTKISPYCSAKFRGSTFEIVKL